jgi:hypothetical protein
VTRWKMIPERREVGGGKKKSEISREKILR